MLTVQRTLSRSVCMSMSSLRLDKAKLVYDKPWPKEGPLSAADFVQLDGFGRIDNRCPMPATIVSASSPAYASVELHESKVFDGLNRMRAVPELRIAPQGAAMLQPGGLHLMLMRPKTTLKPGSRVAIEFILKDGRKLLGEFELRKPAP